MPNTEEEGASIISLSELLEGTIGDDTIEKEEFTLKPAEDDDFMGLGGGKTSEELDAEEAKLIADAAATKAAEDAAAIDDDPLLNTGKTQEQLDAETAEAERVAAEKLANEGKTAEEIEAARVIKETEDAAEAKRVAADEVEEESDISKNFKKSLDSMFDGEVESIVDTDEEGNEVTVLLADIEMTQEVYEDIVRSKIASTKAEAKADTVSTVGISDFTKDLIEIDRQGGNYQELLDSKETYLDVLDKVDLQNVEDQKKVVTLRLRAEGSKNEEEIDMIVRGYEAAGKLEDKAESSDKEIRSAVAKQVETAKADAVVAKKERKANEKAYKKVLRDKLDTFDLSKQVKDKVATLATKTGDNGRYELDDKFYAMKNNPEMAHKLALFILDPDEYGKQVGAATKKNTQLNTARKLKIIRKVGGRNSDLKAGSKGEKDSIISLANLNGPIED